MDDKNNVQLEEPVEPCKINISDLPVGDTPYKKLSGKPITSILIVFTVGLLLLIFAPSTWVLGVFMIAMSILSYVVTKSYTQFAFYNNYFVIYPTKEDGTCMKVNWSDIEEWTVSEAQGSSNALTLRLKNPSRVKVVPVYSVSSVYAQMNKKLPNLETTYQKREAFRKKTANWKWFWQKKNK